jgi:hypothetical protein
MLTQLPLGKLQRQHSKTLKKQRQRGEKNIVIETKALRISYHTKENSVLINSGYCLL